MARLTPDEDQQAAIDRMVQEPTRAALNASQYGTGKTLVTVEVALALATKVNLIVAPLFTKYGWEKTILNQAPDANVRHVNSTKSGKAAMEALLGGEEGWYIIGREYFASKNVREALAPKSHRIDFLAYDECAKWSNRKTQGYKNMMKMKPGYRMALSATPAGNKFEGLWAISRWLWPETTPRSFWNWVAEWCETTTDFFAGVVIVGEKEPGEYVSQLPCYIRLTKYFGDPIEEVIEIDLSPAERRVYDKFVKYLIVWLGDNPLIAKFPIVKRLRLRQMTLGEVSIDPETEEVYFDVNMKSSKYDTLIKIIEEYPDEPMLIFTHSAKYAMVVAYKMLNAGYRAMPWTGEVSETNRHAIKEQFESGELDYIVATIASIGEGVDGLQHRSRFMVWLSRDDNNQLNMQAFRRLYRRGQEQQVISLDIAARDTYDLGQLDVLLENQLRMNRSLRENGGEDGFE